MSSVSSWPLTFSSGRTTARRRYDGDSGLTDVTKRKCPCHLTCRSGLAATSHALGSSLAKNWQVTSNSRLHTSVCVRCQMNWEMFGRNHWWLNRRRIARLTETTKKQNLGKGSRWFGPDSKHGSPTYSSETVNTVYHRYVLVLEKSPNLMHSNILA